MSDTLALLRAGVPEGTRRAYESDRHEWTVYCDAVGVAPLPPVPEALAEFMATLLTVGSPTAERPRPLTASSAQRRLAAVSTWAVEQGHGRPDLRAARLVLRGHRRTTPAPPRQAAPVTISVLRALLADVDADAGGDVGVAEPTLRASRDRAMLLLGFAVGARRSELVALDVEHVRRVPEGLVIAVRRAKTSEHAEEVAVPWAADAILCPVRAVMTYIAALRERGVHEGALFRRITRTDALLRHRLRPEAVADIVARHAHGAGVAVPDGFGGYSGHSLRRGFATEARRAGADSLRIARQGGWADNSASLARYLADVERWEGHPLVGVL